MRQYPIWNIITACIYKSGKSYGVKDTGEVEVRVGTSSSNSHTFLKHTTTHRRVENFDELAREILEKAQLLEKERSPLANISAISSIFSIMANAETEESIRANNEQRKRFYLTQDGISFPSDWDSLSVADQKKRLDMCDYIGLNKATEVLNNPTSKTI
jgi:hypothetical protein